MRQITIAVAFLAAVLAAAALAQGAPAVVTPAAPKADAAEKPAAVTVESARLPPEGVQMKKKDADRKPPPEIIPPPAGPSDDAVLVSVPVIPAEEAPEKKLEFNLELLSMFQWRNDADFDRTAPYYGKYGQEVGIFGTFLKPMITARAGSHVRFYYEAEIGLDLWSRNNPDVGLSDPATKQGQSQALGFKQREIYGEANGGGFAVKAGFQRVLDLSTLFVNSWIGAARLTYGDDDRALTLTVGEYPEQTFKGWEFADNSLSTDVMLYGLDGRWRFMKMLTFAGAAYFLDDGSIVDRRRQVTALEAKVLAEGKSWHASAAYAGMIGYRQKSGADAANTAIKAWGAMCEGAYIHKWFELQAVGTLMSADDKFEGNDSGAFLFSGRRMGPSTFLTENDLRPLGDNLDKRIGVADGVFTEMRAGLWGFDLSALARPLPWLKAGPIFGVLGVMNSDNALGSSLAAIEAQLYVEATFWDGIFSVVGQGGAVIPGGAGAAYVNYIDPKATDTGWFVQSGLVWRM